MLSKEMWDDLRCSTFMSAVTITINLDIVQGGEYGNGNRGFEQDCFHLNIHLRSPLGSFSQYRAVDLFGFLLQAIVVKLQRSGEAMVHRLDTLHSPSSFIIYVDFLVV